MILKVYADFPTEISEGRKSRKQQQQQQQQQQWARLKKARKEGSKDRFFSKPKPDKLFVDGHFVPF